MPRSGRPPPDRVAHHRDGFVRKLELLIVSALVTGLGLGSMYGLLALGFYVTYAVSSTVNFAQGSSMMLGAVLGFTFGVTLGWPFAARDAAALVALRRLGRARRALRRAAIRAARAPNAG